ncbi:uncharacterized protein CANTADRAFT_53237 [Suhomyces tanzawaensis NRRL Y-17324]|uniref:LYR motif-containing protein 5A n=1 Tax=Suhomyces tanzawaensis NRRL Y-17324 TaxID=984487 RepID=A0A1E4SFR2_9ASCO|nr:uncharacterized protein CANTADRAFT_53237 [Suhomyces tanzawaensis NRRL Y-17324]ODV78359.1 hypothetical protein CANTADRAFT_53237 [Suhomyces tanzawaensis NRRL Y-17324]
MDPRVRNLYRNLLYMGRDYPVQSGGYGKFRQVLKKSFQSTRAENEQDMAAALEKGEYVTKELEALYFLSRYRDLKRKYT